MSNFPDAPLELRRNILGSGVGEAGGKNIDLPLSLRVAGTAKDAEDAVERVVPGPGIVGEGEDALGEEELQIRAVAVKGGADEEGGHKEVRVWTQRGMRVLDGGNFEVEVAEEGLNLWIISDWWLVVSRLRLVNKLLGFSSP